MTPRRRRVVLFVALAAVVGWSGWLGFNDDASDQLVEADIRRAPVAAPDAAPASESPVATPVQATSDEIESRFALSHSNLFPGQTWYVAPPPPPPPPPQPELPPPPPEAPPLPYSYMGRWQESGSTTYYLARGTLPVSVRPGQVLDGVWKLESASADTLNFMYLPLNQTRSLRTGE